MTENAVTSILTGSGVNLIKKKIILAPPEKDVIVKVTDREDEIIIESSEVVQNGDYALVKGYLNKSISYNTTNKDQLKKLIGKEENKEENKDDNKKGKKGVICEYLLPTLEVVAVDGVVRHTTVWIPFEVLVYIEGATKGDKVLVENKTIKYLHTDDEVVEDEFIVGISVLDVINIDITVVKSL